MAKKAFGKLAALLTIAGAAAAGISYLTKYRSFNKELDEDFPNKNPNQSVDKEGRHRKAPQYHRAGYGVRE